MSFNTICLWLQVYVVDAATRLFWNPNTITMIRSSPARAIQRTANARRRVTVARQRCGCGKSGSLLANNETGQRQVSQTNLQCSQHGLGPQEFSSLPIDPPGLATGRRSPAGKACISKEHMHEQRGASRGKILLTALSGFLRCTFVKASRPFVMSQCEHFNSVGGVPVQFMHVGRSVLAGLALFRCSRSLYIWSCRFEYLVCMRNLLQEIHWILRIVQQKLRLGWWYKVQERYLGGSGLLSLLYVCLVSGDYKLWG